MQFNRARKTGRGDQLNGLYMEVGCDWEGEPPWLPGRWENMLFEGDGDGQGTQTNGVVIEYVWSSGG